MSNLYVSQYHEVSLTEATYAEQYKQGYEIVNEWRSINNHKGRLITVRKKVNLCETILKTIGSLFFFAFPCFESCCKSAAKECKTEGFGGLGHTWNLLIEEEEGANERMIEEDDEALGINRYYPETLQAFVIRKLAEGKTLYQGSNHPEHYFLPVIGPVSHSSFALLIPNGNLKQTIFVPVSGKELEPLNYERHYFAADQLCDLL